MQAGDRNTSFFHKQCRVRISQNHISKISTLSGESYKGITQIKQVAEAHFQKLFSEDGCTDLDLTVDFLSNILCMVTEEENIELMKPFAEQEIVDVIWAMEPDKAPGPDSFSFHLYRVYWKVIRKSLLRILKSFHLKSKVGGCANSTLLALIPK